MLSVIENKSSFSDNEIVRVVRRENNSKRNYLLVNGKQGKHIPADPSDVLMLFSQLAGCIRETVKNEKVVFIGFAETATAVGAGVASCFSDAFYIHTTRETYLPEKFLAAEFKEEHSHAVEQLLYCENWQEIISSADRIVFVEDEISTGKTILNFVNVLRKDSCVSENIKFSACSILNGMSEERRTEMLGYGIEFYWLVKINAGPDSDEVYTFSAPELIKSSCPKYTPVEISGKKDPRTGIKISEYTAACSNLSAAITDKYSFAGKDIAVIGTEECMYPAIYTAREILEKCSPASVVTHSSTRSPIVAENTEDYPLKTRFKVESFYDKERKTFLYNSNLKKYDTVLVITDSEREDIDYTSFFDAFSLTEQFIIVRWVK